MITNSDKISLLTRAFGNVDLCKDNVNVSIRCPDCSKLSSQKKKLSIHLETNFYQCWVCGLKGRSVIKLFRQYAQSYMDDACKVFKSDLSQNYHDIRDVAEIEKIQLPNFKLLANNLESKDPDIRAAIAYCYKRGLGIRDLWHFKLGICDIREMHRRVVIPSFDVDGELNYYTARSIDPVKHMKYLNSNTNKTKIIFNEININWTKELAIVEGPFDLMKCNDNSTCLLGSALSIESKLFRCIIRNQTPIVLALDPDALKKTYSIANKLVEYGVSVKLADIPDGMDVGDMSRKEFTRLRNNAREWDLDFKLNSLISTITSGSIF